MKGGGEDDKTQGQEKYKEKATKKNKRTKIKERGLRYRICAERKGED
jgi:hypothetical protein